MRLKFYIIAFFSVFFSININAAEPQEELSESFSPSLSPQFPYPAPSAPPVISYPVPQYSSPSTQNSQPILSSNCYKNIVNSTILFIYSGAIVGTSWFMFSPKSDKILAKLPFRMHTRYLDWKKPHANKRWFKAAEFIGKTLVMTIPAVFSLILIDRISNSKFVTKTLAKKITGFHMEWRHPNIMKYT